MYVLPRVLSPMHEMSITRYAAVARPAKGRIPAEVHPTQQRFYFVSRAPLFSPRTIGKIVRGGTRRDSV